MLGKMDVCNGGRMVGMEVERRDEFLFRDGSVWVLGRRGLKKRDVAWRIWESVCGC